MPVKYSINCYCFNLQQITAFCTSAASGFFALCCEGRRDNYKNASSTVSRVQQHDNCKTASCTKIRVQAQNKYRKSSSMINGLERRKVDSEIIIAQRQSKQGTPNFMIAERQDGYSDVTTRYFDVTKFTTLTPLSILS